MFCMIINLVPLKLLLSMLLHTGVHICTEQLVILRGVTTYATIRPVLVCMRQTLEGIVLRMDLTVPLPMVLMI